MYNLNKMEHKQFHDWKKSILKCLTFLFCISFVNSIRHDIHEMMYKTFDGSPACFRRLNGTHQFGCTSPRGGSYGVVHFIKNETDLSEFLEYAVADPYAIVLTPVMFRRDVINSLISSEKVSGIVLNTALSPEDEPLPEKFSPDDSCPNKYSGIENPCEYNWNTASNMFLFYDWPIPVFLVNDKEHYNSIADCHNRFNPPLDASQLSRPLCSLHLNSHMYAAVNSEVCLRRINYYGVNPATYCDPLGDENVVLPTLTWKRNETRNVIIVSARIDSLSLFDSVAPGAISSATGLVTLITTAYIFHKMISDIKQENNEVGVMFILFNGEAEDYIGSTRIVYDMEHTGFPSNYNKIFLDNVRLIIELSQLSAKSKVFIHHTSPDKEVNDFINYLNETKSVVSFKPSQATVLPPASFQSFYKVDKNIEGAILSSFDKTFTNIYYNSIFDTAKYLGYVYANGSFIDKSPDYQLQNTLADISFKIASYLYKKAYNKPPPTIDQQKVITYVDELLHCYIETRKCKLMKEVGAVTSDKVPDLLPLYVGVKNNPENYIARITGFIIAYLTGKKLKLTRENCVNDENQKDYSYFWMNGENAKGVCINSSILFTPCESPAHLIENYNWKSGKYPTWTESVWRASTLGMFIKPFRLQEVIALYTGLVVLTVSFIIVYWFNKKANTLFTPVSPTRC